MRAERREAIFVHSLFVEMIELWARAQQPAHRIPEAIVRERQLEYFHWRLEEAVGRLEEGDGEVLGEVLEEMLMISTGQEEIINWRPVTLEDARRRIGKPIVRMETNGAEC
jgi:hypothetical protein